MKITQAVVDSLTAQLATLQAENERLKAAGRWEPLPDWLRFIDDAANNDTQILASFGGSRIEFENASGEVEDDKYICLPNDIRLCRFHPGQDKESEATRDATKKLEQGKAGTDE